jgi:hypothetical protein
MKKKLLIIAGSILGLGVAFTAGNIYTKASGDWETNAINTSYSDFLSTANQTQNEISSNISDDVNTKISNSKQNLKG